MIEIIKKDHFKKMQMIRQLRFKKEIDKGIKIIFIRTNNGWEKLTSQNLNFNIDI